MNTIGKILVILNFLFAVTVGLLLVFDIALRNKWKEAHNSLIEEARVIHQSRDSQKNALAKILADYKEKLNEIEGMKLALKDAEAKRVGKEDALQIQIGELNAAIKDKQLLVEETKTAKQRLVDEISVLNKDIKSREITIVRLEADVKKLRTEAVQFESLARTRQTQNETLLEQVRELTLAINREKSGIVSDDVKVIRNPNDPNPPAGQVNGRIEKVDIDLVQLSLGTDHGVAKNNTLDVYRLTPEPKYLGMVRIVDANHHQSVGRLIPSGNAAFRTPLRVGDLVTSQLTKK